MPNKVTSTYTDPPPSEHEPIRGALYRHNLTGEYYFGTNDGRLICLNDGRYWSSDGFSGLANEFVGLPAGTTVTITVQPS